VIPGSGVAGEGVAGSRTQGVLRNQDAMAVLGVALGIGIQWIGDIGIQRNVQNELTTTYAREIADILARGNGVLVIIRMQEWSQEDFNGMRARTLLGVSIQEGLTQQGALNSWQQTPRYLRGAADGWRTFDQFLWIDPSR